MKVIKYLVQSYTGPKETCQASNSRMCNSATLTNIVCDLNLGNLYSESIKTCLRLQEWMLAETEKVKGNSAINQAG